MGCLTEEKYFLRTTMFPGVENGAEKKHTQNNKYHAAYRNWTRAEPRKLAKFDARDV